MFGQRYTMSRNAGVETRNAGVGTRIPPSLAFNKTKYVPSRILSNYYKHQNEPFGDTKYEFEDTGSYEQNIENPRVFIRTRLPKGNKNTYLETMRKKEPMDPRLLYVKYLLDARKQLKGVRRKTTRKTMDIDPTNPGGPGRIKYGDLAKFLKNKAPEYVGAVLNARIDNMRRRQKLKTDPYRALRQKERKEIADQRKKRKEKREAEISRVAGGRVLKAARAAAVRAEADRVAKRDRARAEVDPAVFVAAREEAREAIRELVQPTNQAQTDLMNALVNNAASRVETLVNNAAKQAKRQNLAVEPRMTRAKKMAAAKKAAAKRQNLAVEPRMTRAKKAAAKKADAAGRKRKTPVMVGGSRKMRSGLTTKF